MADSLGAPPPPHAAIHRSGYGAGQAAQLRGMPGIGKSLLAQEYALRFRSAFPGGVFWFDLHSARDSSPTAALETYAEQVTTVADALGVARPADAGLPQVLSRLAVRLGERTRPACGCWTVCPTVSPTPLEATMLARPLTGHTPADDVLRLLSLATPAPLSQASLETALASVPPYTPWEVGDLLGEALDSLLGSGALHPDAVKRAAAFDLRSSG